MRSLQRKNAAAMIQKPTRPARFRRTLMVASILSIVGLTANGCSFLSSATPQTDSTSSAEQSRNLDTWLLPLDQFALTDKAARDDSRATGTLYNKCMDAAGFTQQQIPWYSESISSYNSVGRRLFTEELARTWGYHEAHEPTYYANYATNLAANTRTLSAAEQAAGTQCIASLRKELPDIAPIANQISGYAGQAFTEASTNPAVVKAQSAWRECMLPAGVSDLPDSPADMPSQTLKDEFDISPDTDSVAPTISAREREVASMDAGCRTTSGYQKTSYEAEWDAQTRLVSKNADLLARLKDKIATHNALVQKILNNNVQSQ